MTIFLFLPIMLLGSFAQSQNSESGMVNPSDYLSDIKTELQKEWPKNRTMNIVFYGHSVPAGYFKTPHVGWD